MAVRLLRLLAEFLSDPLGAVRARQQAAHRAALIGVTAAELDEVAADHPGAECRDVYLQFRTVGADHEQARHMLQDAADMTRRSLFVGPRVVADLLAEHFAVNTAAGHTH